MLLYMRFSHQKHRNAAGMLASKHGWAAKLNWTPLPGESDLSYRA